MPDESDHKRRPFNPQPGWESKVYAAAEKFVREHRQTVVCLVLLALALTVADQVVKGPLREMDNTSQLTVLQSFLLHGFIDYVGNAAYGVIVLPPMYAVGQMLFLLTKHVTHLEQVKKLEPHWPYFLVTCYMLLNIDTEFLQLFKPLSFGRQQLLDTIAGNVGVVAGAAIIEYGRTVLSQNLARKKRLGMTWLASGVVEPSPPSVSVASSKR